MAFGDNNEEVKQIIEEANAGMMFGYEESGERFLNSINNFTPNVNHSKQYDRVKISKTFYRLLSE